MSLSPVHTSLPVHDQYPLYSVPSPPLLLPSSPLLLLQLRKRKTHKHCSKKAFHAGTTRATRPEQLNFTSHPRMDMLPAYGVSDKVVGVLGGGQLGRMLCQAASQMGIKVIILDPDENCPASVVSHYHMVGRYDDSCMVQEFAKRCEILTVEIEHVDVATIEQLEKQGVDCQPKAATIRIIQDKFHQKDHFFKNGIPLPKFIQVDDVESAISAGQQFGYPLMLKRRRQARDGRGNAVAHSEGDLSAAISALEGFNRGLYAEKWAPFVKELSVIVARERDGSILCYPVVETVHRKNICHRVEAPANVSGKVKKLAIDVAEKAVRSLEGAGVFAVELFLTNDEEILLNEVAPRPHNSGHHTIESCYTSQFEQHLRAITGLPLGDPSLKTPAAIMYNLLGEEEHLSIMMTLPCKLDPQNLHAVHTPSAVEAV